MENTTEPPRKNRQVAVTVESEPEPLNVEKPELVLV